MASRDTRLARQFLALADTLVDDYDVVDLLDQLVHGVVDLLPVDHAGLLLRDDTGVPQLVASTSESTRLLELFQLQSREGGPCLDCLQTGAPVTADASQLASRWPAFHRKAADLGFASVHALPLRLRKDVIGALNLFGDAHQLTSEDLAVGQSMADMATIGILQERSAHEARIEAEQLQRALSTRVVIEQAKGVVAEYGGVDVETSFAVIRDHARHHNLKLGRVAEDLAARRLDPGRLLPKAPRA